MAKCKQNQASLMMFFAHCPSNMALLAIALLLMAGILGTTPDSGPTTDEVLHKRANGDRGKAPAVNQTSSEWEPLCDVVRLQLSKTVAKEPGMTCEETCAPSVEAARWISTLSIGACIVAADLQPRCLRSSARDWGVICPHCQAEHNRNNWRSPFSFSKHHVRDLNYKCQVSRWLKNYIAPLLKQGKLLGHFEGIAEGKDVFNYFLPAAFQSWFPLLHRWIQQHEDCKKAEHFGVTSDGSALPWQVPVTEISEDLESVCMCESRLFLVAYKSITAPNPYASGPDYLICNGQAISKSLALPLGGQGWGVHVLSPSQENIGCSWHCSCDKINDSDNEQAMCFNGGGSSGTTRYQFDLNVAPEPDSPFGSPQTFL